jgi:hypothetical protein
MHHPSITAFLAMLAAPLIAFTVRADDATNLIGNPGFEDGDTGHYLSVAGDSKGANCRYTLSKDAAHTGSQGAILQADDFARCSVGPKVPCHPLNAGDHYRIGVWVKAGPGYAAQPGTPGVALRLNPASGFPPVAAPFLIFINLDGTVNQGIAPNPKAPALTGDWTHLEAVVEIPSGIDSAGVQFFMWKAKGSVYVDDFTFDKVDNSVPASPTTPAP